jgi:hypothetical protein
MEQKQAEEDEGQFDLARTAWMWTEVVLEDETKWY